MPSPLQAVTEQFLMVQRFIEHGVLWAYARITIRSPFLNAEITHYSVSFVNQQMSLVMYPTKVIK